MNLKKIAVLFIFILLLCTGCKEKKNPLVTMEFDGYGEIQIELYPNVAPNTVANFVELIESGFYDDNSIHRVAKNFVIQGGDPEGNGSGGPGYSIEGEFSQNGFNNSLSHKRGVISMARSNNPDSAGSQFFIVLDDSAIPSLDGMYASFGKVIKGMDVVDQLVENAKVKDSVSGLLEENYKIKKVTVDTFGQTYKAKKITSN